MTLNAAIFELPVFFEAKKLIKLSYGECRASHHSDWQGVLPSPIKFLWYFGSNNQFHCGYRWLEGKGTYVIEMSE